MEAFKKHVRVANGLHLGGVYEILHAVSCRICEYYHGVCYVLIRIQNEKRPAKSGAAKKAKAASKAATSV